jgi:hypothetical protein
MAKRKRWTQGIKQRIEQEIEAEELAGWLGEDVDQGWSAEFIAQRQRDSRRMVNTAMKFWQHCPQRKCRRHRRCAHDPDYCGPIFWPVVPEEIKAWWRALHQAKAAGRSLKQALRDAAAAQRAARIRRFNEDALDGKLPPPPGAAPPPFVPRDPSPRLRSL